MSPMSLLHQLHPSALPGVAWLARQPWWALTLLGVGALLVAAAALINGLRFYYRHLHHLRNLPGGAPAHWLLGDFSAAMTMPTSMFVAAKLKAHGHTYRGHQILGEPMVVTTDDTAISYLQQHPDLFIKPPHETDALERFLGRGLVMAEHAQHRRQRKVINPAFSWAAMREMVPFFFQKGYELCDHLNEHIEGAEGKEKDGLPPLNAADVVPGARKADMGLWLNKVAFDVIGLAGFDIDFACLSRGNEVVESYRTALAELMRMSPLNILQNLMPDQFNWIPSKRNKLLDHSHATTQRVGRDLVARKKAELKALQGGGNIEKDTNVGKDLLSLIVKANMAADLPANQRLTDQEIIDQVSTFILAGSETSSNGVGWMLYRLATDQAVQTKLREELMAVPESEPSLETLNTLTYLDKVVHESLRLDPPVPETIRMATGPAILPLGSPIIGEDGKPISSIALKKGDVLIKAFINMNRDKTVWGEDALEFDPERFDRPGIPMRTVPAVWGNLASFSAGPRHCIGYRFALIEMKVLIFTLIRKFKFERLPSNATITQKNFIVMLPWVVGEEEYGSQLPLLISPVGQD